MPTTWRRSPPPTIHLHCSDAEHVGQAWSGLPLTITQRTTYLRACTCKAMLSRPTSGCGTASSPAAAANSRGHHVPRGPMRSAPISSQIKVTVRQTIVPDRIQHLKPRWLAPEHAGRHGMQHPATRQAERTQATKARRGHERAHAISQLLVGWGLKDPGRTDGILRSLRSRLQRAHTPPSR